MGKIIVYGMGTIGKMIAKMLTTLNLDFILVDGNPNLWGQFLFGKKIVPSIELKGFLNEENLLVVCIRDDQEEAFVEYCRRYVKVETWQHFVSKLVAQYENVVGVTCTTDFKTNFKKWWFGLKEEIEFWEESYAKPEACKHDWYIKLVNNKKFYDAFFDMSIIKSGWKIIDVGSGIVSRYGEKIDNGEIELTSVDPLAPWYNKFNKKYNKEYCKKEVRFGLLEELSEQFQDNSIDMVIISNALDHCIDPFRCIEESLKVIKVGGYLYIKTLIRESCNEKAIGLHQWNLDTNENNEFIIWNTNSFINVSKELKGTCEIVINRYPADERGLSGNWGFMTIYIIKQDNKGLKNGYKAVKLTDSCYDIFSRIAETENYRDDMLWKEGYETVVKK